MIPGHRFAMRVIHPGSPLVRQRYPRGILVDPYGFPRWRPFARATVGLPDPVPGLTLEEQRVVDVLAAKPGGRRRPYLRPWMLQVMRTGTFPAVAVDPQQGSPNTAGHCCGRFPRHTPPADRRRTRMT